MRLTQLRGFENNHFGDDNINILQRGSTNIDCVDIKWKKTKYVMKTIHMLFFMVLPIYVINKSICI